jgi:ubiquinone/menaquinone biosynthesis C-methylase UbiE
VKPVENLDQVRARFGETAERYAARAEAQIAALAPELARFVSPRGDERAIDAGTGAGALALALAPHVGEVVGVDIVPELLEHARRLGGAVPNVSFVEGDITRLPFDIASFDLAATMRTLHHVPRPELVVAELARVTRLGGHVLVIDQIAPVDPLIAIELDRFERARDPAHTRLLPDADMRHLFEANGLVLIRGEIRQEQRDLDAYLELAGAEGEARERARSLAPADPYRVEAGWYLLRR